MPFGSNWLIAECKQISQRFAGAAIALLLAAAVPVSFHALVVPVYDDCANPRAFFGAARIGGADMVTSSSQEVERAKGTLRGALPDPLAVLVMRTFSPSQLYWSPIALGFQTDLYLGAWEARWLEAGDDVLPVHWASDEAHGYARVEAYALVQGGVPVWHPVQSGLALALTQLIGGTRPVTVLMTSGFGRRDELPAVRHVAERWLVSAWQQLEETCGF